MRGMMAGDLRSVHQIDDQRIRFRAQFGAERFQAVARAVDQHHAGPRGQHMPRAFETDAGCRAGDGGDLTFERFRHLGTPLQG